MDKPVITSVRQTTILDDIGNPVAGLKISYHLVGQTEIYHVNVPESGSTQSSVDNAVKTHAAFIASLLGDVVV